MAAFDNDMTSVKSEDIGDSTSSQRKYEEDDYTFDGNNTKEWSEYLETNGFCVIRSQLERDEIEAAKVSIWNDMEASFDGVVKSDIQSWGKIPNGVAGILGTGLPQTIGPWIVRGSESIRKVFAEIWKTDELLVSMDSILMWLPWWHNSNWKPVSEGLHLDQNPFHKPDRCCVQGMVPLLDVSDGSGGLEVVPFSHTPAAQARYKELHPFWQRNMSDWCVIRNQPPSQNISPPVLLKAKAGDLILWDSRLIHGGRVGTGKPRDMGAANPNELARLAIPVCMTPKAFVKSKNVLEIRQRGFKNGSTFTHWPHEAVVTNRSKLDGFSPLELSDRTKELI